MHRETIKILERHLHLDAFSVIIIIPNASRLLKGVLKIIMSNNKDFTVFWKMLAYTYFILTLQNQIICFI